MNAKRILAIIGICAWAALIITTIVVAFIVDENTHALFNGLIAADIILPVLIWVLLMIGRAVRKRRGQYSDFENEFEEDEKEK